MATGIGQVVLVTRDGVGLGADVDLETRAILAVRCLLSGLSQEAASIRESSMTVSRVALSLAPVA